MKFRDFIRILEDHGFEYPATWQSPHYKGVVGGRTCLVVVACHRDSDDIKPGTLSSMIRQSGLPKRPFRA